ncbi:MAG: hypothetical protein ACI9FN_000660 [Saprospiraceae bacterium]
MSKKKAIAQSIKIENQAMLILDPPLTFNYNIDSTYVLCIGAGSSRSNSLSKSYCVFDNIGNLVSEKNYPRESGFVYDSGTLIIEELPQVIRKMYVSQPVIT